MNPTTNWEALTAEAEKSQRREKRITLGLPIEVCGFDHSATFFTTRTTTINISRSGCSFKLKAELQPKSIVALKLLSSSKDQRVDPEKPLLFQIVWTCKGEGEWLYGAAKVQPHSIWCVGFPEGSQQSFTAT